MVRVFYFQHKLASGTAGDGDDCVVACSRAHAINPGWNNATSSALAFAYIRSSEMIIVIDCPVKVIFAANYC